MKFTQIPTDTFEKLQLNAGIIVDTFTPATGVIGNIIGATSGGVNFSDSPTFSDFGDDIDNCPRNTMELKRLDQREVTMSGTFVTVSTSVAKKLVGAGDIDGTNTTKIVPRNDLLSTDFGDVWWVGDYSDENGANGGFIAIHLLHALNTSGFQIQSGDRAKGQFAFSFMGHYSIEAQDVVPYELYIKAGTGATGATGAT